MGPDVAIHWDAPSEGREPTVAARRSLAEWAEARGFQLVGPRDGALPRVVPDERVATAVEEDLERARDAMTALDTPAVERALTAADARLTFHPELPQAAWLRAETLRAWGTRWQRLAPRDSARAAMAWARASSLDGGRAPGVGETGGTSTTPPIHATLAFDAEPDGDRLRVRLDGVLVVGRDLVGARGEHQLTVTQDDALLWAGWVGLGEAAGAVVRVALPEPSPCTGGDLGRARLTDGRLAASGVACPDWIFAREDPLAEGELLLASCERDRCGAAFRWRVGPLGPVLPPARAHVPRWPTWATVVIVGAGVTAAGVVTLAATGVFRPTEDVPMFTTGKLHMSATPSPLRLPR